MERDTRRKTSNQSLGRASLLWRRDLAWTVGFPLFFVRGAHGDKECDESAIDWYPLEQSSQPNGGHRIQVDAERLRRSEFAASKLRHQFPRAVKKLFSDPDDWFRRFDSLMVGLKQAVYQRDLSELIRGIQNESRNSETDPAPRRPVAKLLSVIRFATGFRRNAPSGRDAPWTSAALTAFHAVLSDRYAESALLDCRLTQPELEIMLLTQLGGFIREDDQWASLGRLLTSPAIRFTHHPNPNLFISFYSNACRELLATKPDGSKKDVRATPPSSQSIRPRLLEALRRATQNRKGGQAMIKAISVLGRSESIEMLESVGAEVYAEECRLRGLLRELKLHRDVSNMRSRVVRKPLIGEVNARTVPDDRCAPVDLCQTYLNRINSEKYSAKNLTQIAAFLETTSRDHLRSMSFLKHLLAAYDDMPACREKSEHLDKIFSGLLRLAKPFGESGRLTRLLHPPSVSFAKHFEPTIFSHWLPDSSRCEITNHFLRISTPTLSANTLDDLWQLLEGLLRNEVTVNASSYSTIPEIVAADLGQDRAVVLMQQIGRQGDCGEFEKDEIKAANEFCVDATALLPFLQSLSGDAVRLDIVKSLKPFAEDSFSKRWICSWVLKGRWKNLAKLAGLVTLLRNGQLNELMMPVGDHHLDWIKDFPSELHSSLSELAKATIGSEEIARNILSTDIIDRQSLERELEHLRRNLLTSNDESDRQAKLRGRCQNIERQLSRPKLISLGRFETLNHRVMDRATLEYARRIEKRIWETVCRRLGCDGLELNEIQIDDAVFGRVALGISQLDTPLRNWGEKLLELVLQGKRFEELEYPGNQKFIERLRSLEIDVGPWMDIDREWLIENDAEKTTKLAFAKTPMDYLLMGHHFRTCLSPGDINFFSTVSNAIDVNKRVIYGYEGANIVGRCLVALDQEGRIVRFTSYAHQRESNFHSAVEEVLDQLATEMGTTRSTTDQIPQPESSEWYDDGAVAPGGLTQESPEERYSQSLKRLSEVTKPSADDYDTLEKVTLAALSRIHYDDVINSWNPDNPEWMFPAWTKIIHRSDVDSQAMLTVADMANRNEMNGAIEFVIDLLGERRLMRIFRNSGCYYADCNLFHFFVSSDFLPKFFSVINPTLGLRLLRTRRPRRVRKDLHETDPFRCQLLAICHERLGRKELVRKLRRTDSPRRS